MSLAVAIPVIAAADLALLALLAFVMALPRHLAPHAQQVAQPAREDAQAERPHTSTRGRPRALRPSTARA